MSTTPRPEGNTLPPGTSRLGFIFDGDERTPLMAALLENTGDEITLTIPWIGHDYGEEYRRWFSGGIAFGDDPERTQFAYKPPTTIEFHDAAGRAQLLFCSVQSSRIGTGPGNGVLRAGTLVLNPGTGVDYAKLNGLRSEIHGLGDWMDLRSLEITTTPHPDGTLHTVDFHLESPPRVSVDRGLNLQVVPSYSYRKVEADRTLIHERMFVETQVANPRTWEDHLAAHRSLRDLLIVSSWRHVPFSGHTVRRIDDPLRAMAGNVLAPAEWKQVESHRMDARRARGETPKIEFAFTFPAVQQQGFRKWIKLRKHFSRGIDPLISSVVVDTPVETRLAEVGMGFEAIGYRLSLDSGTPEEKARWESHESRLQRVVSDLTLEPPVEDLAGWPARSADAYNSVKHANRAMPEHLELLNAWREAVEVFRYWVAGRIGVRQEHMASHRDRLSTPFQYA